MRVRSGLQFSTIGMAFVIAGLAVGATPARAAQLPASATLPVVFERTIDAGKAKAGDVVRAKTIQAVSVPGAEIRKGATLDGHVVEARGFVFDPTHYAVQKPSYLSIHFDQVEDKGVTTPINVSVRALANSSAADEASRPRRTDDTDSLGTMVLIGGDHYSPIGKELVSLTMKTLWAISAARESLLICSPGAMVVSSATAPIPNRRWASSRRVLAVSTDSRHFPCRITGVSKRVPSALNRAITP